MLKIKRDAQPLRPGWKNWGDRFPSHNYNSGDDRIFEQKTQCEKDGAITETSKSRNGEISPQLTQAWSVKHIGRAGGAKTRVHEIETSQDGGFEERNSDDSAGEKFSNHQDLSSYRDKKLVMESVFDHFAAEQPGKNPHASEEDAQPEIIELHNSREDLRILLDLRRFNIAPVDDGVSQDH